MKNKFRISIFTIIVLLIALGLTTTAAISYWKDVVRLQNATISISDNMEHNFSVFNVSESFNGNLVPIGKAYFQGEQDEIIYIYHVTINKELLHTTILNVRASSVSINDSVLYKDLVQVEVNGKLNNNIIDLKQEFVEVIVKVRLLEPVDLDEISKGLVFDETKHYLVDDSKACFEAIRGQRIGLTIRFEVLPKHDL